MWKEVSGLCCCARLELTPLLYPPIKQLATFPDASWCVHKALHSLPNQNQLIEGQLRKNRHATYVCKPKRRSGNWISWSLFPPHNQNLLTSKDTVCSKVTGKYSLPWKGRAWRYFFIQWPHLRGRSSWKHYSTTTPYLGYTHMQQWSPCISNWLY